jgi:hypothetical protein
VESQNFAILFSGTEMSHRWTNSQGKETFGFSPMCNANVKWITSKNRSRIQQHTTFQNIYISVFIFQRATASGSATKTITDGNTFGNYYMLLYTTEA